MVCSALLLLIPGLASMALDVNCIGPPVPVNVDILVLATTSGKAPSITSRLPAALYPVSEYVTSLELSDLTSLTEKL